jgi:hypothetical protein
MSLTPACEVYLGNMGLIFVVPIWQWRQQGCSPGEKDQDYNDD